MPRLLTTLFCAALLLPLSACQADSEATYVAGTHYEVLPQAVPTADPTRIEVAEVFWYGCSHCYAFEPFLEPWKAALADDVAFVGVPAIWAPEMKLHAKAYYTAKALKVLDKLHIPIFEAMNLKKLKLASEAAITELFIAQGVSAKNFSKVFNSWGVAQQVKQAEAKQRGYRTQGTPELVVNGKYRISGRLAGGHEGMLKVAAFLIELERQTAQ